MTSDEEIEREVDWYIEDVRRIDAAARKSPIREIREFLDATHRQIRAAEREGNRALVYELCEVVEAAQRMRLALQEGPPVIFAPGVY